MLQLNLLLDIESTFSGEIVLIANTGGVCGVKIDNRYLKILRDDSYKNGKMYVSQSLVSLPKSE